MAQANVKLVLMGRIGAAHGIKGQVRILPFTADPMALVEYGKFATSRDGLNVTITRGRAQKNMLIATLQGIVDRTAAEGLNGVELFLPRSALPVPDEPDEFYIADLIGLAARNKQGELLGTVSAIRNHGAGDVLEITPTAGQSFLLAFTAANVPAIKLSDGYLVLSLPANIEGEPPPGSARS